MVAGALACLAALTLVVPAHAGEAGTGLPQLVTGPDDGLTRALQSGQIDEQTYALARARALFGSKERPSQFAPLETLDPRSASLVLRDLAIRQAALPPAQRRAAKRILARPTDGSRDRFGHGYAVASRSICDAALCVHWVDETRDAPPLDDVNADGVPDWVETTLATFQDVWAREVGEFGYRAPLLDDNVPGQVDGRFDVYLVDIGDEGVFGYAASDDPSLGTGPSWSVSAYIVVDNDFASSQFPKRFGGLNGLQVTAAHEFFHAVQFAYDIAEDTWFMQAGASWMEDEVYDDVDTNRVWLPFSALGRPDVPIDYGGGPFQYANWIFLRYLSEQYGREIMRDVWTLADSVVGAPDLYSIQAIKKAVRMRGRALPDVVHGFGVANRFPSRFYEEGSAFRPAPRTSKFRLGARGRSTGWRTARLNHLTQSYYSIRRGAKTPAKAKIKVVVRLPKAAWGRVSLVVVPLRGEPRVLRVALNGKGRGARRVPFQRGTVRRIDVVLTNASVAYDCWELDPRTGRPFPLACSGKPLHDRLRYRFKATVVR